LNLHIADVCMPTPIRAAVTDDPGEILRFAEEWFRQGSVALATLVEIRGGAAKALGSQVAVASDGRFCGYLSGGCVEAAVASEALLAMAQGRDRIVTFGNGSSYFDIILPCGGGISVAIHLLRDVGAVRSVIDRLDLRQQAALVYCPAGQSLKCAKQAERSRWFDGEFVTVFRPRTRIAVSGKTVEATAVACLAAASGYDVAWLPDDRCSVEEVIDDFTAVVLLHHDLDLEAIVLEAALRSPAFYIGALGSTRTHRRRVERLTASGHDQREVERIKAPIGLFGPTRDSSSLALSVLADVAAARLAAYA
jgi:xanthine dehydrogenase accessory factor